MRVKLTEICTPKQWKTIPANELLDKGYPVYGANGIIGYYNEYNHENPVVAITCRGATCGTINITVPQSYVTGNAMCLDDTRSDILPEYLYYCLLHYDFNNVISGSAQPQITRQGLEKVEIKYYPIEAQKKIVAILSKTRAVITAHHQQLQKLDELVKARFVELFGDPNDNPKGYSKKQLKDTCRVITGNTPSRAVSEYYGEHIEWIKTDNIQSGLLNPTTATESLSEKGMAVSRTVESGAILMVCIAGSIASIGRVCVTDRKVSFNQQINAIVPSDYNILFLYVMLQISKEYLVDEINMALKGILSKSKLEEKTFYVPPIELQEQFAAFVEQTDKSKVAVQKALDEAQMLFDSLMQKYFG